MGQRPTSPPEAKKMHYRPAIRPGGSTNVGQCSKEWAIINDPNGLLLKQVGDEKLHQCPIASEGVPKNIGLTNEYGELDVVRGRLFMCLGKNPAGSYSSE